MMKDGFKDFILFSGFLLHLSQQSWFKVAKDEMLHLNNFLFWKYGAKDRAIKSCWKAIYLLLLKHQENGLALIDAWFCFPDYLSRDSSSVCVFLCFYLKQPPQQ